jgi:hypothetical protein
LLAFLLSLVLFFYWGVVGYAVVSVFHTRRNLLRNCLLAPTVGVATTLLPIFWLSRFGMPVKEFATYLAVVLLFISIALIWKIKPVIPLRRLLPFVGLFVLALFLTGRPMLEFGFDWLSFSNDDMANYTLAAQRFLNDGYFDIPDTEDLLYGRNYSLFYWFMHVPGMSRSGSELLLAWIAGLTHLTPHQIFMPVILALHLTLISASGALVCQSPQFRQAALVTCGLMSLSALSTLGALYQLIAQVGGLGLLIGCATVLLRSFSKFRRKSVFRQSILLAILVSALLVDYPEVLPFLVLSYLFYVVVSGQWKLLQSNKQIYVVIGLGAVTSLLLLNRYVIGAMIFLLGQTGGGLSSSRGQIELFPFFLIPSGLANLWGFLPIPTLFSEPGLSIVIALGGVLLLVSAISIIWCSWRGFPVAAIAAVMFIIGFYLFFNDLAFGLFKLAMYCQPFFLASVVITWFVLIRNPTWRIMSVVLLGVANLYSQTIYVEKSRGEGGGGFIEVPRASATRINQEFRQLISTINSQELVLDTSNVVQAKLQALYIVGKDSSFPSRYFFENIAAGGGATEHSILWNNQEIAEATFKNLSSLRDKFTRRSFDLHHDKSEPPNANYFISDNLIPQHGDLIKNTPQQSLFNRRKMRQVRNSNTIAEPLKATRNHLVFIHSELGNHYYLGNFKHISFFQLEKDLFFSGKTFSGIGRHFLFQIVNPSRLVRLELDMTATLKGDKENLLPPAAAIGTERKLFSLIGRGSARVFSPPLAPQMISNRAYIEIDMGVNGKQFPFRRTGLMKLYGTDINLDPRRLVGFARDISIVSEGEYAKLSPPEKVESFPADLANPDLEYSGIYEDGWISEAAFLALMQPEKATALVVKGMVPKIDDTAFQSELIILVDGKELIRRRLNPGKFEVRLSPPTGSAKRRVDLRFAKFQRLPGGDNRPVAAKLDFVGFVTSTTEKMALNRADDPKRHEQNE